MKSHNKLKFVCTAMIVLALSSAQAQESAVKLLGYEQSARLIYESDQPGTVQVNVTDETGAVLSSTTVETEGGFLRPYSFRDLPPGVYYFDVTDSKGHYKRAVKIGAAQKRANQIALSQVSETGLHLTVKRRELSPLKVELFDADGHALYQDHIEGQRSFGRTYQLAKFQGKEVLVRVSDKQGVIRSERITL